MKLTGTQRVILSAASQHEDRAVELLSHLKGGAAHKVISKLLRAELIDRQTKGSYVTYEAAEQAALVIKKAHPIVRVVICDTVERVDKVIELP